MFSQFFACRVVKCRFEIPSWAGPFFWETEKKKLFGSVSVIINIASKNVYATARGKYEEQKIEYKYKCADTRPLTSKTIANLYFFLVIFQSLWNLIYVQNIISRSQITTTNA